MLEITNHKCPSTAKTVRFSPLRMFHSLDGPNTSVTSIRLMSCQPSCHRVAQMLALPPYRLLIQSPNKHLSDISVCLLSITFHAATAAPVTAEGEGAKSIVLSESNVTAICHYPRLSSSLHHSFPSRKIPICLEFGSPLARSSFPSRSHLFLPADFPPFPRSSAPVIVVSMHSATTIHDCGDK